MSLSVKGPNAFSALSVTGQTFLTGADDLLLLLLSVIVLINSVAAPPALTRRTTWLCTIVSIRYLLCEV